MKSSFVSETKAHFIPLFCDSTDNFQHLLVLDAAQALGTPRDQETRLLPDGIDIRWQHLIKSYTRDAEVRTAVRKSKPQKDERSRWESGAGPVF